MKAIAYSLFGFNKREENCFDFNSYLRGLMINIRFNRLIYPDWKICLQIDYESYNAYKNLFDKLDLDIEIHDKAAPLTLAMLWRLRPIFKTDGNSEKRYTHVLCRDLDSVCTYREAQAVKYWMNRDKAMHAITDSVSHNLPVMGGMIGFNTKYFTDRMGVNEWRDLININPRFNWEIKGNDQSFLNEVIYPKFSQHGNDSITQHYILGMPNTFLSDYHNKIQDMELDISVSLKETNDCCGHIGSAGYYNGQTSKLINKYAHLFTDLIEIESQYSDIFSWVKNGCY